MQELITAFLLMKTLPQRFWLYKEDNTTLQNFVKTTTIGGRIILQLCTGGKGCII